MDKRPCAMEYAQLARAFREEIVEKLSEPLAVDQPAIYRIAVQGRLREGWSGWFDGMDVSVERGQDSVAITTLMGRITDQAALHGLLNRIRDLNLPLILVQLVHPVSEVREKVI